MNVYACQMDIVWEDKPANYAKIEALLTRAKLEAGGMIVLPEMTCTGFSMNAAALWETENGPTEQFFKRLAAKHDCCVVGGVILQGADGKGLNQSLAISPEGKVLARYSKIHPFALGGELKEYSRGSEIVEFEWGGFRICPFICYDLRFPEIFRTAVRRGIEMFVVIADWPSRRDWHWVRLLEARAIENLACVVGVNRSGTDPFFPYPGRSLIIDSHGKILADAGPDEGVASARLDVNDLKAWRSQFPALQDMHWKD